MDDDKIEARVIYVSARGVALFNYRAQNWRGAEAGENDVSAVGPINHWKEGGLRATILFPPLPVFLFLSFFFLFLPDPTDSHHMEQLRRHAERKYRLPRNGHHRSTLIIRFL